MRLESAYVQLCELRPTVTTVPESGTRTRVTEESGQRTWNGRRAISTGAYVGVSRNDDALFSSFSLGWGSLMLVCERVGTRVGEDDAGRVPDDVGNGVG